MSAAKKNFIGLEGFIWWIGVVEDRNDPEQLGRVRVRCFGWHTDQKELIPTDALPWAHPVIPVNNPNTYTPKEGDMVFGFFIDGNNAQNPAIMGVLPGKPENKPDYQRGFSDPRTEFGSAPNKPDDPAEAYPKGKYLKEQTTNRLSRGKADSTVIATRKKNLKKNIVSAGGVSWAEPPPAFNPKYPYNNALETESGHALEFDDTPGQERIHLAHRKGTFFEIDKDGNEVHKVVRDNYELVMGSDYVYINGKCSVTVGGDCNLKVGGNMNVEVAGGINMSAGGDIRMKGKKVFVESTSDLNIKSGGVGNMTSAKKLSLKGQNAALQGAIIDLPAAQINMQSGSATSASGAGLTGGGVVPNAEDLTAATEAAANTAVAAATADGLEEVTITAQRVAETTAGSVVGKALGGGLTSTISNVFAKVTSAADKILQDFVGKTPLGEIQQKLSDLETTANQTKGQILSLKDNLKVTVTSKLGEVSDKAIAKNLEFNVDPELLPQKAVDAVKTVIGKHIYPLTETKTTGDA
jgi:Gp5 N-terminal OB domain